MDSYKSMKNLITGVMALFMMVSLIGGQTIDQIISSAARTSQSLELFQDDNNLLVELDMIFSKEEWQRIQRLNSTSRFKRNTLRLLSKRWPGGEVPVTIDTSFNSYDKTQVRAAFGDYHRYTCIRFRPAKYTDSNRIVLQDGKGCSSKVGMDTGSQTLNLAPDCRKKGVIMHELGHALGFVHEQSREDRDSYIKVVFNNVKESMRFNFYKYSWSLLNSYNVPYDYDSIMHYGPYAFTRNGKPTIITKDKGKQYDIGNRYGFSFRDIKLLNAMYRCDGACQDKPTCPGEGFVGKDCKCWCPGSPVKPCPTPGTGTGGTGGTGNTGGSGGSSGSTDSACVDIFKNCGAWAAEGECTTYKAFMHMNCKRSCSLCDQETKATPAPPACEDGSERCGTWSRYGFCTSSRYGVFVREYCPKSCGKCPTGAAISTDLRNPGAAACRDTFTRRCPSWARRGQCEANPTYMRRRCRRSCNFCG